MLRSLLLIRYCSMQTIPACAKTLVQLHFSIRHKSTDLDYSRYPTLNNDDIEETFMRGSGPGGQAVNKTSNCVMLRHKPTNVIVKCHTHRVAQRNRAEARSLLLDKLDTLFNGEHSIAAQRKAIEAKKGAEKKRRQEKRNELKKAWEKREGEEKSD